MNAQDAKNAQNLATKLRGSDAGVRLGNQLFSSNAPSLNAVQVTQTIRSILATFGYNLDKNVVIPLDGAQVIMAGGAFVNSLETAMDIKQIAMPAALTVKAISTLGKDLGIMDENTSEMLTIGADVAMVVACGGMNILADVALILDVVNDISQFENKVKADAYKEFNSYFKSIMEPQKQATAAILLQYQKGNINIFEVMGEVAQNAPNLFPSYFPELNGFIPEYLRQITVTSEETSWWGDHRSYDVSQQIIGIYNGKDIVEQGILEKYVIDPLKFFYDMQNAGRQNCISINALTILSLATNQTATPLNSIGSDWSALPLLRKYRVTPYTLGDEWFFQGIAQNSSQTTPNIPYSNDFIKCPDAITEGGFSVNGVEVLTDQQKLDLAEIKRVTDLENLMFTLDRNGDIEGLMQIPEAVAMLNDYCTPQLSYPKIQDYWQGVQILSILKSTPYFASGNIDLNSFNYLGDLSDIQNKMRFFQNFWLAKAQNILAYNNIARYLGTNADNIVLRHYTDEGLGVFKVGQTLSVNAANGSGRATVNQNESDWLTKFLRNIFG